MLCRVLSEAPWGLSFLSIRMEGSLRLVTLQERYFLIPARRESAHRVHLASLKFVLRNAQKRDSVAVAAPRGSTVDPDCRARRPAVSKAPRKTRGDIADIISLICTHAVSPFMAHHTRPPWPQTSSGRSCGPPTVSEARLSPHGRQNRTKIFSSTTVTAPADPPAGQITPTT